MGGSEAVLMAVNDRLHAEPEDRNNYVRCNTVNIYGDRLHAEPEDRNPDTRIKSTLCLQTGSMRSLRIEIRLY